MKSKTEIEKRFPVGQEVWIGTGPEDGGLVTCIRNDSVCFRTASGRPRKFYGSRRDVWTTRKAAFDAWVEEADKALHWASVKAANARYSRSAFEEENTK